MRAKPVRTICFTSFTFSYLARARVMAHSLRRIHPDWEIWAVITDRFPAGLSADALAPFDRVLRATSLGIDDFRSWIFRHDLVEAATAVKAAALRLVLQEKDVGRAVYLDPDIAVFAPLDPVLASPDGHAVVLTPHQITPNASANAYQDSERTSLRYGVYNLGFLSVANDADGRAFADWWDDRLREACYDSIETGLFTDQKYCDLVPGLFPRVHISRDAGCNVASWNLSRRHIGFNGRGALTVRTMGGGNGQEVPLRFYHFTKIAPRPDAAPEPGDRMSERYAGDNVAVHELLHWYKTQLQAQADKIAEAHAWSYGVFHDGSPVPRGVRLLWRARRDLREAFANPFGPQFLAHLREHHADLIDTA